MKQFKFLAGGLLVIFLGIIAASAREIIPINRIQGDNNMSPYAGKQVTTKGIVTATVKRGFYIQTPDSQIDDSPQTSEGIYVFTNRETADVSLGDEVEVTGTVSEYKPQNERYFLPLTEITRPNVKIISQGNPLPEPITLTTAELTPQETSTKWNGLKE